MINGYSPQLQRRIGIEGEMARLLSCAIVFSRAVVHACHPLCEQNANGVDSALAVTPASSTLAQNE
jgi:hypothetical protein